MKRAHFNKRALASVMPDAAPAPSVIPDAGPGRPRLRVQEDPGRYKLALHKTLIDIFEYREYSAARMAIAAFGDVEIVASGQAFSAIRDEEGNSALAGPAGTLVERYRIVCDRGFSDDIGWLNRSFGNLNELIIGFATGDPLIIERALRYLREIDPGWVPVIAEFQHRLRSIVTIELDRLDEDRIPRRGAPLFHTMMSGLRRITPDFPNGGDS